MLGSVNGVSRAQVGASLDTLRHHCGAPYANSTYDKNISHFRNNEWIEAPAVVSAEAVYALAHVDSHDEEGRYLYTSTTLFSSHDAGATFAPARPPPGHLVATTPYDNTALALNATGVGFGMPSSILWDPASSMYYVMLLSSWGHTVRAQEGGLCLLRTADVTDPASWRAWDGKSFSASLTATPLLNPVPDPDAHTCAPLRDASGALLAMRHLSLLRSSFYDAFLLFGEAAGGGALNQSAGWAFSLSTDLTHWSVPTQVATAGLIQPAGTARAAPTVPLPGRFIKAPGTHTAWEEPGGQWKAAVSNCEPCPGLEACAMAESITAPAFDAIPNATFPFSCTHVYTLSGYSDYAYSVLADDAAQRATGADPSLNVVGQDAHLFLVAKKCAGVNWSNRNSTQVSCTPLDGFLRDQRDIVRASIHFE